MATRQYIGARYVPKFFNFNNSTEWIPNMMYEALTIVTRNGNSYTSKIPVPANVGEPELNPEYWASTGIYNAQIEAFADIATQAMQKVDDLGDDGAIGTDNLADNSVTSEKIADDFKDQFIDGNVISTTFANAYNETTKVWYRLIGSEYKPYVAYDATGVDYGVKMTNESGATCGVTASRFRTANGGFYGYFRIGNNTLHPNDLTSDSDSSHILCCKDGILSSQPITKSTDELNAMDFDWCLVGFEDLIVNGEPTGRSNPSGEADITEIHPRSFIAQCSDNSYIIGVTDGRSPESKGFTLSDIYRFLKHLETVHNISVRYAYSLDGGGSVTLTEKGHRINSFITNENRKIKSTICFKKPDAYYNDVLKSGTADIEVEYREQLTTFDRMTGPIRSTIDGDTLGMNLYALADLALKAHLRFQRDRVFLGVDSDFSYTGHAYNLLDIGRANNEEYINMFDVYRFIPKASYNTVDFVDELPNTPHTTIAHVRISTSDVAETLGLTREDYGHALYLSTYASVKIELLMTRAHIFYRYAGDSWKTVV